MDKKTAKDKNNYVYQLKDVSKYYHIHGQNFSQDTRLVTALNDVTCNITNKEIFGIVGESGSGKSTLIRQLVGAEKPSSGTIVYDNFYAVEKISKRALATYQAQVKMIFQDPGRSLNHRLSVREILLSSLYHSPYFEEECARLGIFNKRVKIQEALDRIVHTLKSVDLDSHALDRYPTEFSGGQRQRIAIVRALVHKPNVLICDEITSALDASTRRNIIDLLISFKQSHNITIIFITHDLSLVLYLCDTVMVMSNGKVEEVAPASQIFSNPQSRKTKQLLDALPKFPKEI